MFQSDLPEENELVSPPTVSVATSLFSELARAVANERSIGMGNTAITLEDLVREILKPLLREWLDQNLPYMIERMVKQEIEKMVNRAERF
jgi:hypothetical protein